MAPRANPLIMRDTTFGDTCQGDGGSSLRDRMPAEPTIRRHLRRGRAHRTQGARTHADAELAATSEDRAVPARPAAGHTDLVQAQSDAAAQPRNPVPARRGSE